MILWDKALLDSLKPQLDLKKMREALEHGADVHATNAHGKTPLHLAVVRESAEAAQCLLAHGADPLRRDKHGFTPLRESFFNLRPQVALAIIKAMNWNPCEKYDGMTLNEAYAERIFSGESLAMIEQAQREWRAAQAAAKISKTLEDIQDLGPQSEAAPKPRGLVL